MLGERICLRLVSSHATWDNFLWVILTTYHRERQALENTKVLTDLHRRSKGGGGGGQLWYNAFFYSTVCICHETEDEYLVIPLNFPFHS